MTIRYNKKLSKLVIFIFPFLVILVLTFIKINEILRRLGAPAQNKGYRYIKEATIQCLEDPTIFESGITKVLYPSVALTFNTTHSRVERAIRHEVEVIFSRGNTEFVNELFPYCMGKATNSEFLATLVEYLRAN